MKTVKILKATLPVVASIGAGAVAGTVLKAFTPVEAKTINKVTFAVGSIVLTSMAGNAAARYTENYIDETANQFKIIKEQVDSVVNEAN